MVTIAKRSIDRQITSTTKLGDKQQLAWLLLLSCAYILRDVAKLPLPGIVFTGLCGMAFTFLSPGSAMGVYMFTSTLTVPDMEIRVVYIVILAVKFWAQRKKINATLLMLTMGLLLLELTNMTVFSHQNIMQVLYAVVMRLSYFILPLFWFSDSYSKEDYKRAMLCYMAGALLGGAVLLYISVDTIGWDTLLKGSGVRLGMNTTEGYSDADNMQTAYNANQLGIMLIIAATIVLVFMDNKRISKWLGLLLLAFSSFLVFLSKSRTSIFLGAGVVAIYCLLLAIQKKKLLSATLILVGAILLVHAIISLFPDAMKDLMTRFTGESYQEDNRGTLFVQYMTAWQENVWVLLLGYGIGSYSEVLSIFGSPHNMIADILISWGLVGLGAIVCLLILMYRHGIRHVARKERVQILLPALVALAGAMTGQYLTVGYPHMRMCFLLLATQALSTTSEECLSRQEASRI